MFRKYDNSKGFQLRKIYEVGRNSGNKEMDMDVTTNN